MLETSPNTDLLSLLNLKLTSSFSTLANSLTLTSNRKCDVNDSGCWIYGTTSSKYLILETF